MTLLARTTAPAARTGTAARLGRAAVVAAAAAATVERLALARTGVGAVMVTRPRLVPGVLGVDSATSARMGWAVQMLGAREIALGLGTWAALRSGDSRAARLWVAAGLLSDATDALVVTGAIARGRLSAGTGSAMVAVAAAASAIGVQALECDGDVE